MSVKGEMGAPLIGVTIGRAFTGGRWRYECAADYVRALASAGGRPVLLPAETILASGGSVASYCAGFLLSGGGDLDPAHYAQVRHPATGPADSARDQAELALVRDVLAAGRPLLAICRGIQVLNVALGGDLLQDLPSSGLRGHDQDASRDALTHQVAPAPGSLLAGLIPAPFLVNSFHHQAVARMGRGLVAAAHAQDGVIEAVCLPGRLVLGVQWHPECCAGRAPEAAALFAWLVGAAKCRPTCDIDPADNAVAGGALAREKNRYLYTYGGNG